MRQVQLWMGAAALLCGCLAATSLAQDIQIQNVLVKLIDELEIPAPEAGVVLETVVQEGSPVAEGEILARIDDAEARFTHERARIDLAIARDKAASGVAVQSAERAMETAASEFARAEDARSRSRDTVTETEFQRLRLAADQSRFAVEKARQEQNAAKLTQDLKQVEADFAAKQVERRLLKAPFAGVVVQVHRRRGAWVEPGDKMLRLVRLDRLRVEGSLDARHAGPKLQGRPVVLAVDLPSGKSATFSGKLVFVSPEVDPFNKQVRVLAEIDNPGLTLLPGLRGTLSVSAPR